MAKKTLRQLLYDVRMNNEMCGKPLPKGWSLIDYKTLCEIEAATSRGETCLTFMQTVIDVCCKCGLEVTETEDGVSWAIRSARPANTCRKKAKTNSVTSGHSGAESTRGQ